MLPYWNTLSRIQANQSLLLLLSGEATNTNFIVFGVIGSGLEPTIYRTRGEHTNHYTIGVVVMKSKNYT